DFSFGTPCAVAPSVGDVLTINGEFLQVTEAAALSGSDVFDLKVSSLRPVADASTLTGAGFFETPFVSGLTVDPACWVRFLPPPSDPPASASDGIPASGAIVMHFSEPMDPASLSPFGNFLVVNGVSGATSTARTHNLVVGDVLPSPDLSTFTFDPRSP